MGLKGQIVGRIGWTEKNPKVQKILRIGVDLVREDRWTRILA